MSKHTHRGTCQACGAAQAVDNKTQLVAKHGYKVAGFGFFNGTCAGSDHHPAEISIVLTHSIIEQLITWALNADRLAALWLDGTLMVHMHTVRSGKRSVHSGFEQYHSVMMFGCADYTLAAVLRNTAEDEASQARQGRSHIESLRKHVLPRLGQPLYPVSHKAPPRQFNAGDVVTIGERKFLLVTPRYGFRNSSTPRYWKGTFEGSADVHTISVINLRKAVV